MTPFAPTSDLASSGATPVGASSLFGCVDQFVQGDPDYVSLNNEGSFRVAFTGPFANHGHGLGVVWVRYSWNGTVAPVVSVYENGSVIQATTLARSPSLRSVAIQVPGMAGGSTRYVQVANQSGNVGATVVSWLQFQVPNPNTQFPLIGVRPFPAEGDYMDQMGICSRTKYLTAGHDLVTGADGKQYSKSLSNFPTRPNDDRY